MMRMIVEWMWSLESLDVESRKRCFEDGSREHREMRGHRDEALLG